MSRNWRQTRIFSSNFGPTWYYEILSDVVTLWLASQGPGTVYFCMRYVCPVGMDDADTDIAQLPANFRQQSPMGEIHRSLRVRFVEPPAAAPAPATGNVVVAPPPLPATPKEGALKQLIDAHPALYWKFDFRECVMRNDIGGVRFSPFPEAQAADRDTRGELVASVLQANCNLALALFSRNGAAFTLESNAHPLNFCFQTPFQSVAHLLGNVWWMGDGGSPELWGVDQGRSVKMKI